MAIVNPIVSTAEVQTVTVDATGGTFTVTWNGTTTNALAFDVAAATFTTEMDAVADGTGNVVVTGGPGAAGGGTPYTLTWAAANGNVPAPTTDPSSLTGGAGTATVATGTAGVSGLADPWLSVGAHTAPTHPIPDQGDWQWNMMEVAAWMAGEAWSSNPACVSPVIAAFCNALNDNLTDANRATLKTWLDVAPVGVIDTVDAGKETTREWLILAWLIKEVAAEFVDSAGCPTEAAALAALTVTSGGYNSATALAALDAAGRAVWAIRETRVADAYGRIGPAPGANLPPVATDATAMATYDTTAQMARGAGWTSTGLDDGDAGWRRLLDATNAATWAAAVALLPSATWTGRDATETTFRAATGDSAAAIAWTLTRDAIWAGVTTDALDAAVAVLIADPAALYYTMYDAAYAAALASSAVGTAGAAVFAAIATYLDALCAV